MSFLKPSAPATGPTLPAAPQPVLGAQGTKPKPKNQTPTFLGGADIANPSPSLAPGGGKTLLGN